ncbi:MAG: enoyl-ACP reductase [Pseudomonadota bacterium]
MADLLKGKRGFITGIANNRSIAYGIAQAMLAEGAELAFGVQMSAFGDKAKALAHDMGVETVVDYDVLNDDSTTAAFDTLKDKWGTLDFAVHAIAFSDKAELTGRFINTSRENFKNSMDISAFSFIDMAQKAMPLMEENGGSLMTLTYQGSHRATPWYNVMGVAKAALESSVIYLANDLGPKNIRVNAISPGPMKTLSGAVIGGARQVFRWTEANTPLRSNANLNSVGGTAAYLASDYAQYTTGEVIKVDGGLHIIGMPQPDNF